MASITIKATYSLDVETVRRLEEMADRWKVSKSEALRRAIRAAAKDMPSEGNSRIAALDRLQDALGLSEEAADRWEKAAKDERRSASSRRERGTR